MRFKITTPPELDKAIAGLSGMEKMKFWGVVTHRFTQQIQDTFRSTTPEWWSAGSKTLAFDQYSETRAAMTPVNPGVWFPELGTKDSPKPIVPRNASCLAWAAKGRDVMAGRAKGVGQMMFFHSVHHKGIKAKYWMKNSINMAWGLFRKKGLPDTMEDILTGKI